MSERKERIYKALGVLCDACDLKGESGTETLLFVLEQTFIPANCFTMDNLVNQSHEDGLMLNTLEMISDTIEEYLNKSEDGEAIPSWLK
jgi:hypothetical protein